jgi:small GTP-binding protein
MTDEHSPTPHAQGDNLSPWAEVEAALTLDYPLHLATPGAGVEFTWDQVEQELEQVAGEVQYLEAERGYRQAQAALGELLQRLSLTPRERTGLERSLQRLASLVDKLEHSVVHIAVLGLAGRGKSSLLNALVGQAAFATGPLHGVTRQVEGVAWPLPETDGASRLSLPGLGESRVELIDTPGLEEVAGAARQALTQRLAAQVDLVMFVIAGDITRAEYEALAALRQAGKPILLVFNKVDQYPEVDLQQIHATLQNHRLQDLISPHEIVVAAADPLVVVPVVQADGQVDYRVERGEPQVEAVKLKLLEILQREGKALVALNTLIYAQGVNAEILERKRQVCDRSAADAIWNAAMIKAVVVALNPVMVADLCSGVVIDVALILALSRIYGLPMGQVGAIKLLQQIALGLGGITLSERLVTLGLGSLKSLLGASAIASGGLTLAPYLPVALTQAGVAGFSTYGIGQVVKTYLANGADWGPQGPQSVVQEILANLDKDSILRRIKADLIAQLGKG